MRVPVDDTSQLTTSVELKVNPRSDTKRYRAYVPVDVVITDHTLLSVGDLALRGYPPALVTRACSTSNKKRDGLPFLPSMKVGRSRRIYGRDFKQWSRKLRDHFAVRRPNTPSDSISEIDEAA